MRRTSIALAFTLALLAVGLLFLGLSGPAAAAEKPPFDPADQDQPVLDVPSGLATLPNLPQAGTAIVAVFDDPNYVDTNNSTSSESDNVQAGLANMGHIVVPFTGIQAADWSAALSGANVLVIPELENNEGLGYDLSADAINVIRDFVNKGGGLIQFYQGPEFMNPVFGFSLGNEGGNDSSITAAALGTAFEGGPANLPSNNATSGLDASTLPPDSLVLYSSIGNASEVAWLPYGAGQIVYLGWDWYDAAPPGAQDGGWLEVLERAVVQVSADFLGLTPAQARGYDAPGTAVVYTHTLINATGLTDTFNLSLSGNQWPVALPFNTTPQLADGETLDLVIEVSIPPAAAPGNSDTVTLQATSVTSPTEFTASASIETTALCPSNITVSGRSAETFGALDDLWEYGGQQFAVARINLFSDDADTLDASLRGYDPNAGWVQLAQLSDVGNVILFDDILLPANYTRLEVQLDDTEDNDLIYYDYEFTLCRSAAVDVKPDNLVHAYSLPGETAILTYTLTNYSGQPAQFNLATSGTLWPTSVRTTGGAPLSQTPLLPDLGVYTFTVAVVVPPAAAPGTEDGGLVGAAMVGQPAIRNSGAFQVTALSGQFGYAFNDDGNYIQVIDTGLHLPVKTIDVSAYGEAAFLGGLNPDGSRLYVSLVYSETMLVVDTSDHSVLDVLAVGDGPRNVAFSADGAYAFVPNRWDDTLSIIDTAAQAVTDTLALGDSPMIAATSACLSKVYVTNRDSDTVSVIDINTLAVADTISGFTRPWGIAISPFGHWAYVANQESGSISVIDTGSDTVIAEWQLPVGWLQMIDVSPDGRTLYVVAADTGALLVVDAFSGAVLDTIPALGSEAWYVEAFPAGTGDFVYFSRPDNDDIAVVDRSTNQIIAQVPLTLGGNPRGLALFPMEAACLPPEGVLVSPEMPHRVAPAGEMAVFEQVVTNLSAASDTYALAVSGGSWTANLSASSTGPLGPGESFLVTVTVDLPAEAEMGSLQTFSLTASGASSSAAAQLTASVLRPGFVFNQGTDLIHVLDTIYHLDSGISIDISAYNGEPFRGQISPDGSQLYVGLRNTEEVLVIDTTTFSPLTNLPVGSGPHGLAFSAEGAWAFVSNRWDGTLTVIDTSGPSVHQTLPVGNEPTSLAVNEAGDLYIALRNDNAVAVFDISAMTVTQVITGFNEPNALALSEVTGRVYVGNQADSSIGVIDMASHSLVTTWAVPGAEWISDLDVAPYGHRLYITDADNGMLYVLNTANGILLNSVFNGGDGDNSWEVESFPAPAGPYAYVVYPYDNFVGVFNTHSNTFERTLPLGYSGTLRGLALFPAVDKTPDTWYLFTPVNVFNH